MEQIREVNTTTLIEVVKQLESMRNTYRRLHQYEIPVGNPIEKNIEKILKVINKFSTTKKVNLGALAKLSGECIKGTGNDSLKKRISPNGS